MGWIEQITTVFKNIAKPKDAVEEGTADVDRLVREKLDEARKAADSFVGDNVQKLKSEAWAMIDELEKRVDQKLDELEKRLDERLRRELYWKLIGLRWTLIFVLLATAAGIVYTLVQRHLAS